MCDWSKQYVIINNIKTQTGFTLLLKSMPSAFPARDAEDAPPLEAWGWQVRIVFTLIEKQLKESDNLYITNNLYKSVLEVSRVLQKN